MLLGAAEASTETSSVISPFGVPGSFDPDSTWNCAGDMGARPSATRYWFSAANSAACDGTSVSTRAIGPVAPPLPSGKL